MLSALAIWEGLIKNLWSNLDEETDAGACRLSNEIGVGVAEKKPFAVPSFSFKACSTIDKTEANLPVPTEKYKKKYKDAKKAAEAEIMDFIAECWWEWLEGSDEDVFSDYWFWFGKIVRISKTQKKYK